MEHEITLENGNIYSFDMDFCSEFKETNFNIEYIEEDDLFIFLFGYRNDIINYLANEIEISLDVEYNVAMNNLRKELLNSEQGNQYLVRIYHDDYKFVVEKVKKEAIIVSL